MALADAGLSLEGPPQSSGAPLTAGLQSLTADQLGVPPTGFAIGQRPFEVVVDNAASGDPLPELQVPLQLTLQVSSADLELAADDPTRLYLGHWIGSTWQAQPCSRDASTLSCPITRPGRFGLLIAPVPADVLDVDIANGHFYKQANGFSGGGDLGFAIVDDADASMWSEFQRLGGVERVGFPISARFQFRGFLTQAFQKMVLQWRPELGQAVPVNIFDELHQLGSDGWLDDRRQVPLAEDTSADAGLAWEQVVARHVALLDAYPSLRDLYRADSTAIDTFGLPLAVKNYGPLVSVRLQRATLQLWTSDTPWAAAGSTVIGNGGDIAKEAGLWSEEATAPRPLP